LIYLYPSIEILSIKTLKMIEKNHIIQLMLLIYAFYTMTFIFILCI